jgi:putative copper export protein
VLAGVVAWFVLVVVRDPEPLAAGDQLAARLDGAVATSLRADHMAAFATWIVEATTTLVLGGVVFRSCIATAQTRALGWKPDRIIGVAAVLGTLAGLAAVPFRAAAIAGTERVVIVDPATLDFVASSRFGNSALLRGAGLLIAAFAVVDSPGRSEGDEGSLRRRRRRSRARAPGTIANNLLGAIGALLILGAYAWTGHPQAADNRPLLVAGQAIHVLAISTWLGGVTLLYLQIRAGRRAGAIRTSAEVVARFSTAAGVAVAVAALSGIALAQEQIPSLDALTSTHYGRALCLKLGLVVVVLAIGGYNKEVVVPRIVEQQGPVAWRTLHRTLLLEAAVLIAGVLVATTAMISGGI